MTRILTIATIFVFGLGCSTIKGPYTYEICVRQEADSSLIVKNEMIGIADTTAAFFKGQIVDKDTKELLGFANISLTNTTTNKIYGQSTDSLGQFSIALPAENFILRISYVGYQSIKQEIALSKGEIRKLNVELGHGEAFVTYEIKSDNNLNSRRLSKRVQELQ